MTNEQWAYFIFNTNAIEGNQIIESEVLKLKVIADKLPLEYSKEVHNQIMSNFSKDIQLRNWITETLNAWLCCRYIYDTFDTPLTEDYIKYIHKIARQHTIDEEKGYNIGEYKAIGNIIANRKTTEPSKVHKSMAIIISHFNKLSLITRDSVLKFHKSFEKIHPFQDGNGRVGRFIMVKQCFDADIEPIIPTLKDRKFYYMLFNDLCDNKYTVSYGAYTQALIDIEKSNKEIALLREDLYVNYSRLEYKHLHNNLDVRDFLLRDVEQGKIKRKSDKYVKLHK